MKMKHLLLTIILCAAMNVSAFGICIYQTASGRLTDAFGNGISGTVKVTSLLGIDPIETRSVRSNQFGYYAVPNVISCENYEFQASAKGFTFTPDTLIVVPSVQSTNINFLGVEQ